MAVALIIIQIPLANLLKHKPNRIARNEMEGGY